MFFRKKKKQETEDTEEEEKEESKDQPEPKQSSGGDASLGQLMADFEKLKAQFSSFYEMQKATGERFTRVNEQIGELRAMLIERDKNFQMLEAKATKAIDMVDVVQPDKFMVEMRKGDSKVEALKANLESNENIMNNIVSELREMRDKMGVFKGLDQVMKLNEEVKNELMGIKKTNAMVQRHGDRVETIFSELQKRFSDFEKLKSMSEDLDKSFRQMSSDLDTLKIKLSDLTSKKDHENLIVKFDDFEKRVGNIVTLLDTKAKKIEKEYERKFDEKFSKTDKLMRGFTMLAQKTPDLDKYFDLLEKEAQKAPQPAKIEKIQQPGVEEKPEQPKEKKEEKPSLFGRLKSTLKREKS